MKRETNPDTLPDIVCACSAVRRAARLITQLYDEELRGHLQASELALLAGIYLRPGFNQAMLAKALGFDKTTLSRNLSLMKRKGWIDHAVAVDRREHGYRLTAKGRTLLTITTPSWKRAQRRLRSAMGDKQWEAMWQVLRNVTNAARRAGKQDETVCLLPNRAKAKSMSNPPRNGWPARQKPRRDRPRAGPPAPRTNRRQR